jgi:hypothetical protein
LSSKRRGEKTVESLVPFVLGERAIELVRDLETGRDAAGPSKPNGGDVLRVDSRSVVK